MDAEDCARLNDFVTTILSMAACDAERITAGVRRAMAGRQVVV